MQPYMNNYFNNNPAYQPQYQYNPLQSQYDRLAQLQAQYTGQTLGQPQQAPGLIGEVVDGIDVVKAKNVDMSGHISFYPKSDMTEIYTKQLQPDGTSRIVTYKAVAPENQQGAQQPVTLETLNMMLVQLKSDLVQEISALKGMVPPTPETPAKATRGGSQK